MTRRYTDCSYIPCLHICDCCLVAKSYPTLLHPYGLPAFSIHGIFQARTLKLVGLSLSRGSSWHRDWTHISCIGRWFLYHWATWEALPSHMPILPLFNIHPPKVHLLQLTNLHETHHDHAMPTVKVHSWCCIFCGPGQIIACSHHHVIRVVSLPPKFSVLLFLLYLSPVTSSPGSSAGKEFTCNAGDLGSVLGWEDPLEKEKATHSSILA